MQQPGQPEWTRSTFCADHACVEVADDGGDVLVRDGKNPEQEALRIPHAEWPAFLEAVRAEGVQ